MTARAIGYGLDMGATHAVVVRSIKTRNRLQHEVVLDDEGGPSSSAFAQLAKTIESETAVGGAVTAGAMPVAQSMTRWLTTPFPSLSKARKVLPALLDIQLPFPLESCYSQFLNVHKSGEHVRALAIAARRERVQERLQFYRDAGIDPMILDQEGLALWTQSLAELPLEPDSMRVVAWVGRQRTVLAIGCGSEFENAHCVNVELSQLISAEEGARQAAISAFAERVGRIVRSHSSGPGAATVQWAWTGPGATHADVRKRLEEALAFEWAVTYLEHDEPKSFLARALAVRSLEAGLERCDFRQGELTHPLQHKAGVVRNTQRAVAVLVLGLLLCGLNAAWGWVVSSREARTQAELTALAEELSGSSRVPYGQEVLHAERSLERRAALIDPFLQAFEPSLTTVMGELLRTAREGGMSLERLSLRADSVSLQGSAGEWSACEKFAGVLKKNGFTPDAPERSDAGQDEKVHFSIKASSQ